MKAIEDRKSVRSASEAWERSFSQGATKLTGMGGTVHWLESVGIWGMFGESERTDGSTRSWNPFGQIPASFRSNIVVEIKPPRKGKDANLQGGFATDDKGRRWVLHQGRMSVPGSRITEEAFIEATGLKPVQVTFQDGEHELFHPVASIDEPAAVLQEAIATFVANCARARLARVAPPAVLDALRVAEKWERTISPEATGSFEIAARDPVIAHRKHAEVWRALAAELTRRKLPHSNERVARYGPDLFTYGDPKILFEIKSGATSQEIFAGVGQLHVYERLLKSDFKKVLVIPQGVGPALIGPLDDLGLLTLEYERKGRAVHFNKIGLERCLAPTGH